MVKLSLIRDQTETVWLLRMGTQEALHRFQQIG